MDIFGNVHFMLSINQSIFHVVIHLCGAFLSPLIGIFPPSLAMCITIIKFMISGALLAADIGVTAQCNCRLCVTVFKMRRLAWAEQGIGVSKSDEHTSHVHWHDPCSMI